MTENRRLLQEMADREAIREQLYNYCRAVDRMDAKLGEQVWHEDGTADYGAEVYRGDGRGFINFVNGAHSRLLAHAHRITNIIIQLDGDRAESEAYYQSSLRMERDGELLEMQVSGRYLDRWCRRDGRWAIDHRLAVRDFDSIAPVEPMSSGSDGSRDRHDPSYDFLA